MTPPLITISLVLLAAGILLLAGTIVAMALTLLRPPRMGDAKAVHVLGRLSPGDLELPFEQVAFHVRDVSSGQPLSIRGWWIGNAHARGRCVLLLHGYGDAKVGALAWAPSFHALGWNLLAIDLRAHGESDGRHTTGGYFERDDVEQVINQIRIERPEATRAMALFGVSLGAAVAAAVAARRDDLAGAVLESPFASYQNAVRTHARLLSQPGGFLVELALRLAERISGADFEAVRPVDLVRQAKCPLLLIHGGADPFVQPADVAAFDAALRDRDPTAPPATHWIIPDAPHVMGLAISTQAFQATLAAFLEEATQWAAVGNQATRRSASAAWTSTSTRRPSSSSRRRNFFRRR